MSNYDLLHKVKGGMKNGWNGKMEEWKSEGIKSNHNY